jgi:hypothetical protein
MKFTATAYLKNKITVYATVKNKVTAEATLKTLSPVALPEILIDSLDGGNPNDITYIPINANGLTGISGGLP